MMLPLEALTTHAREIGMVAAVLLGLAFGFVLERAGFGRSTKLAAQFYLYDMTVFKVMFGAIVTAMLGVVVASGLGIVDLVALREGAVSTTYLWPMMIGGFVLGAGFIISGYCPGTSLVATASGHLDGLVTVVGVLVGSLVFAETAPLLGSFPHSGDRGQFFLYQWLGLSPAVVAVLVAVLAVAAFFGAEKVERIMTQRVSVAPANVDEQIRQAPRPRRFAFGVFAVAALIALVTLLFPVAPPPQAAQRVEPIAAEALAHRVFDEPWALRVIDLRSREACAKQRILGSECVPAESLGEIHLGQAVGRRDLVLVSAEGLAEVPEAASRYHGKVLLLDGGFAAWQAFALEPPAPLSASAGAAERQAYTFQAAVHAALSGLKPPPPPPTQNSTVAPRKKKKGGGCSG